MGYCLSCHMYCPMPDDSSMSMPWLKLLKTSSDASRLYWPYGFWGALSSEVAVFPRRDEVFDTGDGWYR